MTDTKYKVIVSDKAKQMLGMHIRFIAQVNKEAAKKKEERTDRSNAFFGIYAT